MESLFSMGKDLIVDDQLLVKKDVLRLALDRISHMVHQFLAGPELAFFYPLEHIQPLAHLQLIHEIFSEPAGVISRE